MYIKRQDIDQAIDQKIISQEQGQILWSFWSEQQDTTTRFKFSHLAYYFGALIVISAMGWFMNNTWEAFGGMGMFSIATVYAIFFIIAGRSLWDKKGLRIPAGLLIVMAVCMTPLAIYGLERSLGYWPQYHPGYYHDFFKWIHTGWFYIEIGTIISACFALRFFPFPFLTAPLTFSLYFLAMDITPIIFGHDYYWDDARRISLVFGLVLIIINFFIDYHCRKNLKTGDYAFWGYLFGATALWSGLSLLDSANEWSKFIYCLINVCFLIFGILVQRKVFLVFGAIGVNAYIAHLAYSVFQNSMFFPLALSLLGLGIIYAGILYHNHQDKIDKLIQNRVPEKIRRFLPE